MKMTQKEYENYINFIRDTLIGISDRIEDPKEKERVILKVKGDAKRMFRNGDFRVY